MTARDAIRGGQHAVCALTDEVSSRKTAEEARLRTEARFRELIDHAPEPIGIFRDGHMAYGNRAFVRVLGYPNPQELYRVPLNKLVHPDEAQLLEPPPPLIPAPHTRR